MTPSRRERFPAAELAGATLGEDNRGKQLEGCLLGQMLRWLGWSGVAIVPAERPDFFFSLDFEGRIAKVGCELTALYTVAQGDPDHVGSAEARFRAQWRSFAKDLQRALSASGKPTARNVYGAIHFREPDYGIFDRADRDELIREIVLLLEESPPISRLEAFPADKFSQLREHVDHIWTAQVIDSCPLWWAAHLRSGILSDPARAIASVIVDKAAKARTYDWRGSALRWLVITAPGRGLRDHVPWYSGESFSPPQIDIPFSHVFLFAWGVDGWYVLQLHPSVVPVPGGSRLLPPAKDT